MSRFVLSARSGDPLDGALFYYPQHGSFHFQPGSPVDLADRSGDAGRIALTVDTLMVEVGLPDLSVLYVDGMWNHRMWRPEPLAPPPAEPGVVTVGTEEELRTGVSYRLEPSGRWPTGYDETTGWVRVRGGQATEYVQIATGTVSGLERGRLVEIWLQPIMTDVA